MAMRKFTPAQREAARSLAVAYEAYHEASRSGSRNGLRVWGRQLLEAQQKTDVEFLSAAHINERVALTYRQDESDAALASLTEAA